MTQTRLLGRDVLKVALPFALSRCFILLLIILTTQFRFYPGALESAQQIYIEPQSVSSEFARALLFGDAVQYKDIGENGYPQTAYSSDKQRTWAFFPLFPLVNSALAQLTGSYFYSGFLLSNLCFLAALLMLLRLGDRMALNRAVSERAAWFACFFPTSYFFSCPQPESLFFLLSICALLAILSANFAAGGIILCALGALRPTGVLLLPSLAYAVWKKKRFLTGSIALLLSLAGAACFMLYLKKTTGNALAFYDIQVTWGRRLLSVGGLIREISLVGRTPLVYSNLLPLNIAASILWLAASLYYLRRNLILALFLLVPMLVTLSTGTFQSAARMCMSLPPIFYFLGAVSEKPGVERALLAVFSCLLGAMTLMYAMKIWGAMA